MLPFLHLLARILPTEVDCTRGCLRGYLSRRTSSYAIEYSYQPVVLVDGNAILVALWVAFTSDAKTCKCEWGIGAGCPPTWLLPRLTTVRLRRLVLFCDIASNAPCKLHTTAPSGKIDTERPCVQV